MRSRRHSVAMHCSVSCSFGLYSAILIIFAFIRAEELTDPQSLRDPTVVIAILVRNKAHTLPYFLTLLERLEYPKDRISLWIRSDHNEDSSLEILKKWLTTVENDYHSISAELLSSPPDRLPGENSSVAWSKQRFTHVIQLREEALMVARYVWADYVWFLDCDVFLTNPNTLQLLVQENLTVAAPMLRSDGMYSNFWAGMTEEYYYQRTEDYQPILYRERTGCFSVPMVNSATLINLKRTASTKLTFVQNKIPAYDGPYDDIITFAIGANKSGIPLHICNTEPFGYISIPLGDEAKLEDDFLQITNVKVSAIADGADFPINDIFLDYLIYPEPDAMGFDEVYMINLQRRPERRKKMLKCFQELGIAASIIDAVDGKQLTDESLKELDVRFLPAYEDPYHKRPMTMGEVGCFLSHYLIWKTVLKGGYEKVMVLEDDIRFESYFRHRVANIMRDLEEEDIEWDLIYLGRKRMQEAEEPFVEGSDNLVKASYSYWTLGYLLSRQGARKLVDAKPLDKLMPVDEYLPVMFDKHPNDTWKEYFPNRNLIAFSAEPLLVYPTHYTGEEGYISDTEDSAVVKEPEKHYHVTGEEL
ncbi:glycosyltransferase 25 family member [Schistocerca piceifrons]|uniref:glycosyltransferase 25 family member n=1 Tax=Schistocerca piceifrons TaxID=274613 RepID=UPI001F5F5C68|nr:glycosyltransferase 25 family member [Schistocerca piceifrons]